MLGSDDGEDLLDAEVRLTDIEVDIDGLDAFRTLLARELDANLRPGADAINRDHALGVGFGARNAGRRTQAARQKYHASLTTSMANLTSYVATAEVLIDAIRRVTARYSDADASAASLNSELAAAFRTAQLAQVAQVTRLREQEAHREQYRSVPGVAR